MPTSGPVSGRVYIWYPEGFDKIGHASMYIGNYEVGKKFELSIDPGNDELYWAPKKIEKRFGIERIHFNDNYVSWWPDDDGANVIQPQGPSQPKLGLYEDIEEEESEPHVVYDVYGLDISAMRKCWREARDKRGSHYQLYRKNCSDLVMRVLRAGGASSRIGGISGIYHSRNFITAPKDVAVVCDKLKKAGWANKQKAGNCPSKKGNVLAVVLGMR